MATKKNKPERRRYIIGARKISPELRDVAGPVLADPAASYMDVMCSNDDPAVDLGADVTYAAFLTEAEAERFRAASNCRYIEDDVLTPVAADSSSSDGPAPSPVAPAAETSPASGALSPAGGPVPPAAADAVSPAPADMTFMGASGWQSQRFDGVGVRVAVLGGGTSQAMRDRFTWTRVAYQRYNTQSARGDDPLPTDQVMWEDACFQTSVTVPPGGELVEAMVTPFNDQNAAYAADVAAAMIWACDQGAEIIVTFYVSLGAAPIQAYTDAINYLRARGRQMIWPTGDNSSTTALAYPSSETVNYQNVHAIAAWNDLTDSIRTGANRTANVSGVLGAGSNAPGQIAVVNRAGANWFAQGYHLQACKAVRLMAMLDSGSTYTAQQAADGLKASARDTGDGVATQGKGYWRLDNAINYLTPSLVPSGSLHLAQTIRQPIPNNTETKVRYQTVRQYSDDVSVNAARDTIAVHNPGLYVLTASCRWVGFNSTTGDKILMLGNNVGWTDAASKRWKTDSRRGTPAPMGMTIMHAQRFELGDEICVWANQSSGVTWDLEPTIGAPFTDPATFTITRVSA